MFKCLPSHILGQVNSSMSYYRQTKETRDWMNFQRWTLGRRGTRTSRDRNTRSRKDTARGQWTRKNSQVQFSITVACDSPSRSRTSRALFVSQINAMPVFPTSHSLSLQTAVPIRQRNVIPLRGRNACEHAPHSRFRRRGRVACLVTLTVSHHGLLKRLPITREVIAGLPEPSLPSVDVMRLGNRIHRNLYRLRLRHRADGFPFRNAS